MARGGDRPQVLSKLTIEGQRQRTTDDDRRRVHDLGPRVGLAKAWGGSRAACCAACAAAIGRAFCAEEALAALASALHRTAGAVSGDRPFEFWDEAPGPWMWPWERADSGGRVAMRYPGSTLDRPRTDPRNDPEATPEATLKRSRNDPVSTLK